MYLAAILGLCALTTPSVAAVLFRTQAHQLNQETQPPAPSAPPQDSPQNAAPASPSAEPPQSGAESQGEPSAKPQTTPSPEAAQEPQTAKPAAAVKKQESQTKTSSKKRRRRKTAASASTATPEKKVVRNGGTADPVVQLAPGMSAEQASSQRQNTTQLLAATDANLKQISSRPMNSSQQDSISQIRKYMEQAKAAEQAGDVERAHNLASKALLLSDDLVKQ
jgi:outer membrane biosynthesis protein TonB